MTIDMGHMATSLTRGAIAALALAVAGCGGDTSDERSIVDRITASSFQTPNEFAVLPKKPLVLPDDLDTLPEPAPGTTSLADLTPNADAIAAVGGQSNRGAPVASDRALLAATGVGAGGIRRLLAAEDEEYRAGNPGYLLDRLLGLVGDGEIYSAYVLDAEAELLRLRARGIRVPQLPPEGE